jgi:negative regulator of flagellin synthesis FlgM
MKIGHLDKNNGAATPVATERKGTSGTTSAQNAPAAASGAAVPESSTQVALSAGAQATGALGAGGSDFDAEKVQRIAQAIREGRFTVNPEAIADKLIANAQELLSGNAGGTSTH